MYVRRIGVEWFKKNLFQSLTRNLRKQKEPGFLFLLVFGSLLVIITINTVCMVITRPDFIWAGVILLVAFPLGALKVYIYLATGGGVDDE